MEKEPVKKILLLIVEGPSDRTTFENSVRNYINFKLEKTGVRCDCIHGDITVENRDKKIVTSQNVLVSINKEVKEYLKKQALHPKDLAAIVQISDLDCCFGEPSCFVESLNAKGVRYDIPNKEVICSNVESLIKIRANKKMTMLRLSSTYSMKMSNSEIPFRIFYVGIDLEHAFYDKLVYTDEEKESLSDGFDDKYGVKGKNTVELFGDFISKLPSIGSNYKGSWDEEELSKIPFERVTNLSLFLKWIDKSFEN